ncbi:chitosanase [Raineyella fluvialis]|uniref:Chitosanase n=1 Tax=Raineyella fluvialis TaxID=2662261 RepID=A0A5Q2FJZ0_9ACTN|nr:chitosanase [Raineyella fluvialis]QGF24975.1 chitosanase [Raineyella fluvialis]
MKPQDHAPDRRRSAPSPPSARPRRAGRLLRRGVALLVLLLIVLSALISLEPRLPRHSAFVRCVSPLALNGDLRSNPRKQEVAQMMVGSAENSSVYWEDQVGFIQYNVEGNDQWNRGYTGGIIGFTSKTHSMAELVRRYVAAQPHDNALAPFLPALEAVDGTSSAQGLGPDYVEAWKAAAADPVFRDAQWRLAHEWYLAPALQSAEADGLRSLGQFAYYDAMVQHGSGGFAIIHADALQRATPPSRGGDEATWLDAWFSAREAYLAREVSASTATRVSTAQRGLLAAGKLRLRAPLTWDVYGDHYRIEVAPFCGMS